MNQFATESPLSRKITELKSKELLELKEINGIPVDTITRRLRPNRTSISKLFYEYKEIYGIEVNHTVISKCTPEEELRAASQSVIDFGLIGPNDNIQTVLALQRDFIDTVIDHINNPHQVIGDAIGSIFNETKIMPKGMIVLDFKGLKANKKLFITRKITPALASSPFGDGDKSNIALNIFDITNASKINPDTINKAPAIMLSGLHEKFVRDYGFYEESEPLIEFEDPFNKGKILSIGNNYNFLPEGLSILDITDMPLSELRTKYKGIQQQYKNINTN